MKNKIVLLMAIFASFILTACAEKEEKINLYGVQSGDSSRTSPMAYIVFFVLAAIVGFALYSFYKKITKK